MEPHVYIRHLGVQGTAMGATLAGHSDLAARVRSCPGWDLAELARHEGQLLWWWSERIDPGTMRELHSVQVPAADADRAELVSWFTDGLTRCVEAFDTADPDREVATSRGSRPVRHLLRRAAIETAVHRWDAQTASDPGGADPVPLDLALDACSEFLQLILPRFARSGTFPFNGESIHFHATDPTTPDTGTPDAGAPAGEWLVHLHPDRVLTQEIHGKGDVALRAPVSELLLFMWGRIHADELGAATPGGDPAVLGDPEVAERWQRAVRV